MNEELRSKLTDFASDNSSRIEEIKKRIENKKKEMETLEDDLNKLNLLAENNWVQALKNIAAKAEESQAELKEIVAPLNSLLKSNNMNNVNTNFLLNSLSIKDLHETADEIELMLNNRTEIENEKRSLNDEINELNTQLIVEQSAKNELARLLNTSDEEIDENITKAEIKDVLAPFDFSKEEISQIMQSILFPEKNEIQQERTTISEIFNNATNESDTFIDLGKVAIKEKREATFDDFVNYLFGHHEEDVDKKKINDFINYLEKKYNKNDEFEDIIGYMLGKNSNPETEKKAKDFMAYLQQKDKKVDEEVWLDNFFLQNHLKKENTIEATDKLTEDIDDAINNVKDNKTELLKSDNNESDIAFQNKEEFAPFFEGLPLKDETIAPIINTDDKSQKLIEMGLDISDINLEKIDVEELIIKINKINDFGKSMEDINYSLNAICNINLESLENNLMWLLKANMKASDISIYELCLDDESLQNYINNFTSFNGDYKEFHTSNDYLTIYTPEFGKKIDSKEMRMVA